MVVLYSSIKLMLMELGEEVAVGCIVKDNRGNFVLDIPIFGKSVSRDPEQSLEHLLRLHTDSYGTWRRSREVTPVNQCNKVMGSPVSRIQCNHTKDTLHSLLEGPKKIKLLFV